MTIPFSGFKSVSVAVLAVLWLAAPAPAPASAYGGMRIVPNVNPDPVKPGALAQEASGDGE